MDKEEEEEEEITATMPSSATMQQSCTHGPRQLFLFQCTRRGRRRRMRRKRTTRRKRLIQLTANPPGSNTWKATLMQNTGRCDRSMINLIMYSRFSWVCYVYVNWHAATILAFSF